MSDKPDTPLFRKMLGRLQSMDMESYRNAAGTYDGEALMADLTGLSKEELKWTADRLRQLMTNEGRSKDEAVAIVREEAKSRPWEN